MGLFEQAKQRLSQALVIARHTARVLNYGYSRSGASTYRKSLLGWTSTPGSPDEDITQNLGLLRQRSRDLYMGTALATGALKTLRTNIVGAGLRLNSQIDADALGLTPEEADAWEAEAEREFALWADSQDCDAARTNTFGQLQSLALLSVMMSGDCFALLPVVPRAGSLYDLRVQLLEADRVCDPAPLLPGGNIFAGVELGEYGDPTAYYVARYHPGSSQDRFGNAASTFVTVGSPHAPQAVQNSWQRVPAFGARTGRRNMLHLLEQERPEQRRGVPVLAPVIEPLKQLGRYSDAELMAAVVAGFFSVFVKNSATPQAPLGQVVSDSERADSTDPNSLELGNGLIASLAPGEDITIANPTRPNTAFDGFVTAVLRQIGAALDMPHELIVKQFTSSYSASRGALLEAWKMFRTRRTWLAATFCQPVYDEWLAEAVARGRLNAPGFFADPAIRAAWSRADWVGPSQGQLDPLKEVRAAALRVQEGFSTRARETAELTGSDWDRLYPIRVREELKRREGNLLTAEELAQTASDYPDEDEDDATA